MQYNFYHQIIYSTRRFSKIDAGKGLSLQTIVADDNRVDKIVDDAIYNRKKKRRRRKEKKKKRKDNKEERVNFDTEKHNQLPQN